MGHFSLFSILPIFVYGNLLLSFTYSESLINFWFAELNKSTTTLWEVEKSRACDSIGILKHSLLDLGLGHPVGEGGSGFLPFQRWYITQLNQTQNIKKKQTEGGGHWNLHWNSLRRSFFIGSLKLGKRSGLLTSKACIFFRDKGWISKYQNP